MFLNPYKLDIANHIKRVLKFMKLLNYNLKETLKNESI